MTGLIFIIAEILLNPGFFLHNNNNPPVLSKAKTLLCNPRRDAIGEIITEAIRAATDANAHLCPDDDMLALNETKRKLIATRREKAETIAKNTGLNVRCAVRLFDDCIKAYIKDNTSFDR